LTESKSWDVNDIDFDETGRLIIKNVDIAKRLTDQLADNGTLEISVDCNCPVPPEPSDLGCGCDIRVNYNS
jgi:hypothetical protein